ncbi:MAG: hypothetical protein HYV07_18695 [Deltaproteobacteria bacterium]|nr:hypothetical protein [Deltaproteobacteria bacterium]
MRLSINLDPDLYALAKALARAEDTTISGAINHMLRRALESSKDKVTAASPLSTFPVSRGARLITDADIRKLEDEP